MIQENYSYFKTKTSCEIELVLINLFRKGFSAPRKNFVSEVEKITFLSKELNRDLREKQKRDVVWSVL